MCADDGYSVQTASQVPGRADVVGTEFHIGDPATAIRLCPLDGSAPRTVATTSGSIRHVYADSSERHALVVDDTGALTIVSRDTALQRVVSSNIQSAAW